MYKALDGLIIASIEKYRSPLYDEDVVAESKRLAAATGRESFRVIDGRLKALRRQKRITWFTKSTAPDGKAGWRMSSQYYDKK